HRHDAGVPDLVLAGLFARPAIVRTTARGYWDHAWAQQPVRTRLNARPAHTRARTSDAFYPTLAPIAVAASREAGATSSFTGACLTLICTALGQLDSRARAAIRQNRQRDQ